MSDSTPTSNPGPTPDPPAAKPRKKRSWKRRIFWTLGVIVVLLLVLRLTLAIMLPAVINSVATFYDLKVEYERDELSVLDGNARLWYLVVKPKAGGEPILTADYVHGNISVLNLLRGRLVVWRCEADGAELLIERQKDGRIPLLEHLAVLQQKQQEPPKEREPTPLSLEAPLRLDQFRLNQVKARLRDYAVEPNVDVTVRLNLSLSDVGAADAPSRFEMMMSADPMLDSLRLSGEAKSTPDSLHLDAALTMRGLHLQAVRGYLRPLGLDPAAESISADGTLSLVANVAPAPENTISAQLRLTDLRAHADAESFASLASLEVDADAIDLEKANLSRVAITGGRIHASRDADGVVHVAGLRLVPAAGAPTTQPAPQPGPSPAAEGQRPTYALRLKELIVSDAIASFTDAVATPPAELAFDVREFSVRDIVIDPNEPDAAVQIAGDFRAPELVRSIRITGSAVPFAERKTVTLKLSGEGLVATAVRPYLDALGIESELKDGRFGGELNAAVATTDGGLSADLELKNLKLTDGGDLASLEAVSIKGLAFDAEQGIRLRQVDVTGPVIDLRRDADGGLAGIGVKLDPSARPAPATHPDDASDAGEDTTATALAPAAMAALPRLQIDRLNWKGAKIVLTDRATGEARTFELADVGAEMSDVVIDLAGTSPGKPGKVRAWLGAPGLAERLTIDGTVLQKPTGANFDLRIEGTGLSAAELSPYLEPLGIESTLRKGELSLRAIVDLSQTDGAIRADLRVEDLSFSDGGAALASLESFSVRGVSVSPAKLNVGEIELVRPAIAVTRDADGGLRAAGVRIPPPPTTKPVEVEQIAETTFRPITLELPIEIELASLKLTEGALTWRDEAAASTPVETTATANIALTSLVLGRDAEPATLKLDAAATNLFKRASVSGTINNSPRRQAIDLTIEADGVTGDAAEAYLPPGVAIELSGGRFAGKVKVDLSPHEKGGQMARLALAGIDWSDGRTPLAKLESLVANVERFDPDAGVIAIEEVSVKGLEADVRQDADGKLRALGIVLGGDVGRMPAAATTQPATQPAAPSTLPSGEVDVARLIARDSRALPEITLKKLDLNLKRFGIHLPLDERSKPITLAGFRLHNLAPIAAGGRDADSAAPIRLQLAGRVDPIIGSVDVTTEAAPFADRPSLHVVANAGGIRGEGVTEVLPQFAELIDGSKLTDGRFNADLRIDAKVQKRGPARYDWSQPFELEVRAGDVAYRSEPEGDVLVGVEEVLAEQVRVDPQTGSVRASLVQVLGTKFRAMRDAEGVHVLGMVIKLPTAETPSEGDAEVVVAKVEEPAPTLDTAAADAPLEKPKAEYRIDQLVISGLDLRIEDRTTDPVFVLPLNELEVDAKGLSTWALFESTPIRFDVLVGSDVVRVPKPFQRRGLAGALQDMSARGGAARESEREFEDRKLFSQLTASGNITLYPAMTGYVRGGLNALELGALAGPSKQIAVELGGGTFDGTVELRLKENDSADTKVRLVLDELAVAENPGGPIERHLKLPAPLNLVLEVIRDASGAITIPASFSIDLKKARAGKLGASDFVGPALGAIGSVIAVAVTNAPLKIVQMPGGMLGIQRPDPPPPSDEPPVEVWFEPGVASLSPQGRAAIGELLARLESDRKMEVIIRHELGAADVARAAVRANPPPDQLSQLAAQLRRRKHDLTIERAAVAATVRAQLSFAGDLADDGRARLQAIDRELAATEDALDELYNLLRPGADRQAPRRTRAASLALAQQRIDEVRDALLASDLPGIAERVRVTSPQFNPREDERGAVLISITSQKR